jgi:hypothetical protein
MNWYTMASEYEETRRELLRMDAEVRGDMVKLYRGGDVDSSTLLNLRFNDFLSTVRDGSDAYGNLGASSYGDTIVEIWLPIDKIKLTNGEVQYTGTESIVGGKKYPREVYIAYNESQGSNLSPQQIDDESFDFVRIVSSMAMPGGKDEFDKLMERHRSSL